MSRLKEWLGGPIVHNHLKLGDDPWLNRFERQQFTVEAAVDYAKRFTGNPMVSITDTNHALLFIDRDYRGRREISECHGDNEATEILVGHISGQVRRRAEEMRERFSRNILTGVEVDLLDATGRLDVEDGVLAQLDTVIASLHIYTWKDYCGKTPDIQEVMRGFDCACRNPNVDILGHPTYLPDIRKTAGSIDKDWHGLFKTMKQHGVAFEVNMGSGIMWAGPEMEYDRLVVRKAKEAGVPLVVSFDFHNFAYFNLPVDEYLVVGVENEDSFFESNRGQVNFALFEYLRANLGVLRQLDIKPADIINSSEERYKQWQKAKSR